MESPSTENRLVVLFRSPTIEGDVDLYHKLIAGTLWLLLRVEDTELNKELHDCGYVPVSIPVLSFQFDNQKEFAQKMHAPEFHGGLILTSQRAVEALEKIVKDEIKPQEWKDNLLKAWQELPVFVVGNSTAKAAHEKLGFEGFIGEDSGGAERLLPLICNSIVPGSKPLLYPCGNLRRDTIPDGLSSAGIELSSVQAYSTCSHPTIQQSLCEIVENKGQPSHIVFFSPSGVDYTTNILRTLFRRLENIKMVAIGGTTAKALQQKGWNVAAVAEKPNPQSLARCILGNDEVKR